VRLPGLRHAHLASGGILAGHHYLVPAHALVTSGNYLGYNILGLAFRDRDRLDEAIASYREAIRIYPAFQDAHVN